MNGTARQEAYLESDCQCWTGITDPPGHDLEQAPGVGDGQGSLACHRSPRGCKEWDLTELPCSAEVEERSFSLTIPSEHFWRFWSTAFSYSYLHLFLAWLSWCVTNKVRVSLNTKFVFVPILGSIYPSGRGETSFLPNQYRHHRSTTNLHTGKQSSRYLIII